MMKSQSMGDRVFGAVNLLLLLIFTIVVMYPIVWIVSCSISDPFAVVSGQVKFFPIGITSRMYKIVFMHPEIMNSYKNTITYVTLGMILSVSMSVLYAYPLSRKHFFGRKFFTSILMITMFFHGGMIPSFLLIRDLKLLNTMWAIVLSGSLNVYNTIVMRTFFTSIPDELEESVFLDGGNDLQFFWNIVLPLSKAGIAVLVLFYGVAAWNSWFYAFLYTSSRKLYPLQIVLREIILQSTVSGIDGDFIGDSVKYATMVVATLPIMFLYPFLQKYFAKGVMVGSLKG